MAQFRLLGLESGIVRDDADENCFTLTTGTESVKFAGIAKVERGNP